MQINTDDTQASTSVLRLLRLGFEGLLYKSIAYDLETNVGSGGAEVIFAWMNFGYMPCMKGIGPKVPRFDHALLPMHRRRLALGGDLRFIHGPFFSKIEYIRNVEKTAADLDAMIHDAAACNGCHRPSGHGFIRIVLPSASPVTNQSSLLGRSSAVVSH